MTRRPLISAWILVSLAVLQAFAASKEPVTALRAMDKQLSTINAQMEQLRSAATRAERGRDIRRIRAAVLQIRRRASRLESLYRARHQPFGVKMFGELERKSVALSRSLTALEQARSKPSRNRLLDRCSEAVLSVVMQYQAISANLAGNRCEAGQWACCEPKPNPETNRGPAQGCRWACVSQPRSCVGFIGPQTPRGMVSPPQ